MSTLKRVTVVLKCLLILSLGIFLFSCNAYLQDREFQSYMCECNADGSDFRLSASNNYKVAAILHGYFNRLNFPYKIEYGADDDLFAFRSSGIYKYDQEHGKWLDYLRGYDFKYRADNYFHYAWDAQAYYFKLDSDLYRMQQGSSEKELIAGNVTGCRGIPYQPHFSIVDRYGKVSMHNYDIDLSQINLTPGISRAYYFTEADLLVYMDMEELWRCDSDGGNKELLYSIELDYYASRTFYPLNDAGIFITTNRVENGFKMLMIDATNGSVRDLGPIEFARGPNQEYLPFQLSMSRDGSKLLFFDSYNLYLYNLPDMQRETVLTSSGENFNFRKITSASLSEDGSKIRFISEVYNYRKTGGE